MTRSSLAALACIAAFFFASAAHATDLITVRVIGNGADAGFSLTASGNNFVDLVDDVLSQDGAFLQVDTDNIQTYDIEVDYLGITNAIQVDVVADGTDILLRIPSIGFERRFVGATDDDVENQVEDFIESDGANTLAEFLEEVNGRSVLGVLDGNPRSTTALLSRGAYDRFGLGAPRTRARKAQVAAFGNVDIQAEVNGGSIDVDGFDSLTVVDGALTIGGDFEPGFGVYFSVLGQYRDYDGAELFDIGLELAVPVTIVRTTANQPIRWAVTPFLQSGAGASVDLAAGGLMMGGGVVSSASYHFGPLEAVMANELVYYGGIPIDEIGGYDFDTELDRLVLKNGGKLAYHFAHGSFAEAGVTFTNFLVADAGVDFYTTPFVGLGVQLGIFRVRGGWESDFGDDYAAHIGKAEIGLEF